MSGLNKWRAWRSCLRALFDHKVRESQGFPQLPFLRSVILDECQVASGQVIADLKFDVWYLCTWDGSCASAEMRRWTDHAIEAWHRRHAVIVRAAIDHTVFSYALSSSCPDGDLDERPQAVR